MDDKNKIGKTQFIVIDTRMPLEMLETLNLKLQSMHCKKMIDNFKQTIGTGDSVNHSRLIHFADLIKMEGFTMMKKLAKSTANFNCLSKEEMMEYNSKFNSLVCISDKRGKRVEELKIDNKYLGLKKSRFGMAYTL